MNDWLDLKADNEYRIANGERLMNAETLKDFLDLARLQSR
jgi:hypothetical protein